MSYNIFLSFLWIYYHFNSNRLIITRYKGQIKNKKPNATNYCFKTWKHLMR